MSEQTTGSDIGKEEAIMISEVWKPSRFRGKPNSSLTDLNLSRKKTENEVRKLMYGTEVLKEAIIGTDNQIGEEVTRILSEMLKTNKSLMHLDLSSQERMN